jgi:Amt family ammonium transporter
VPVEKAVTVERIFKPEPETYSDVKITKIDIIIKQNKFESLKSALTDIGITGMTVTQVLGFGIQMGQTEHYRGVETESNLLPKVQVTIVDSKVPVRQVIETAKKILYTGHIGDGQIFIYDVENVVKVRTGEEGYAALQDVE